MPDYSGNKELENPPGTGVRGVNVELLKILCCPETHQALTSAASDIIQKLNEAIKAGRIQNRNGKPVREAIDAGLIRADGKFLYPIRHNIPIMLADESIPFDGV